MRSTASINGHPVHPMLIPFPFAFLSGAAMFDLAASLRHDRSLARTARHLNTTGVLTALGAAVPGLVDYLTSVPSGRPRQVATIHMASNLASVGCFALARMRRTARDLPSRGVLALELAGTALLSLGGLLGGRLVYHHGVAVDESARQLGPRVQPESLTPPHGDVLGPVHPTASQERLH